MRQTAQFFVAIAAIVAGTGLAAAKDWTVVRIGTDATYPPFESQDSNGNIVGFDVDIGNALCAEMKIKCEWANTDWDGIIPALNASKIDAILSSMSITEERLKQIDFSDKIYNTPPAVAVAKDSDVKGTTPADLAGKSIGVQSSTTHAAYAEKVYTDSDIRYYKTADDYKLDLSSGRLDAAMDDIVVLSEWIEFRRRRLLQDHWPDQERTGDPRDRHRDRHPQGGHRPQGDVQQGDCRHPGERHLQGDQRQIFQVRRLRRMIHQWRRSAGPNARCPADPVARPHSRTIGNPGRCKIS